MTKLQKVFISNKVYKKYLKLLRLVDFYLTSDDDTGTAYHEALNEIEKFRQLVKNKYRSYLLEQTLKELHQNSCLMSEDVDETLKNAKEQIYNL